MGQFDNFKSIAMLLAGVFLVSYGIINFLNIEIQSRSNHGIKMRNENLFEVLGRKINEMIATLREKNSHRRSLLYHLFTQENSTRSSMRKLQYFTKNPNSKVEYNSSRNYHRLRHAKNVKRLTELFLREKNGSLPSEMALQFDRINDSGMAAVFSNGSSGRTVSEGNEIGGGNLNESLEAHKHCYTTNDVLEIIAITCLVNFIFWFLIIFCVNVFTRNQKLWKLNSCDSLTSIGSGSEQDHNQAGAKAEVDFHTPNQRNFLKNYDSSLANEPQGNYPENELQELYSLEGTSFTHKSGFERHQRFQHLSNFFFGTLSSVNLKPLRKKSLVSRKKSNKIVNSFSMDDLIF